MILLIDNYDSFSYNLYQFAGAINPNVKVIKNDELRISEIESLNPTHIMISPGPGRPKHAGICEEAILHFKAKLPILGVCLGHQAICEVFGGEIVYAKVLMHGKKVPFILQTAARYFVDCRQLLRGHVITRFVQKEKHCRTKYWLLQRMIMAR